MTPMKYTCQNLQTVLGAPLTLEGKRLNLLPTLRPPAFAPEAD